MQEPARCLPSTFLSDHQGFVGTIKNCIQDFVVTEINIHGQQVTKAKPESPPCNEGNDQCHKPKRARVEEENALSTSGSGKTTHSHNNSNQDKDVDDDHDSIVSSDCFDLGVILGPAVSQQLHQFTTELRLGDGGHGETALGHLSLGSFSDKTQRASVHRAVRHNYPFLMTVTNQEEILVKENPDFQKLATLVSELECEEFFRFIDAKVAGSSFSFQPDGSKEHRTSVHHFITVRFGKLVETKSFTNETGSFITARLRERTRPNKKRSAADAERVDVTYTGFVLRKDNLETLEAISLMAAALDVLPCDFSYAGTKDKRAVTHQDMVVMKVSVHRLKEKASEFVSRGIHLSGIHAASEPLHLGRLKGNHFDIVIRDLKLHDNSCHGDLETLVNKAVEDTKRRGFINYYGPQRFGNSQSVQADRVGLALLKEDMEAAISLFFTPDDEDDLPNKAKRHYKNTGNAKEALALMPVFKARERLMLRALHRYGVSAEGASRAWLSLPHASRCFYPHAYCSLIWNQAAAHRIQQLGTRPVQGDLVWTRPSQGDLTWDAAAPRAGPGLEVHVVTAAEAKEGIFSLEQVVLPMPGNSVLYPENVLGSWYRERLEQDGLGSCRFRVPALKLNVPGCYRPLVARALNLTHTLLPHHNVAHTLPTPSPGQDAHRDLTLLPAEDTHDVDRQSQLTPTPAPAEQTHTPALTHTPVLTHTPALHLSFDLNSSCYATVFLREVMRCDLS
ncbi:pseudouridylate synthase PUS7L isoform X2 [Engraulis encrasicolus]